MEVWKSIKGYEGLYEISSFGRVRSCERRVEYFNPKYNKITGHKIESKIKKPSTKDNGYLQITLYKNNKGKNCYIHRLVAEAFIPNPLNKRTVNHKDFDVANNNINNLEWCTYSEQEKHKADNGRLAPKNTRKIIVTYNDNTSIESDNICKSARILGIHRDTIYNIIKGLKSKSAEKLNIKNIKYKD